MSTATMSTFCDVLPAYDNSSYRVDELNYFVGQLRTKLAAVEAELAIFKSMHADNSQAYKLCLAHRDDVHGYVVDQATDSNGRLVKFIVDGGCHDEDFLPGVYSKNGVKIALVSAVYEVSEVC